VNFYSVLVEGAVYGYTADTLPAVGEVIVLDGCDVRVRVEEVRGTDEAGSISASRIREDDA
jgi:hypothetical protein